ncbi:N-acetylmannosamine kinase [Tritonibacter multivorans]|uniref:N-acetylmannosamine kinase n=1 Tax=Tritonibacter multivorans TaxID=928856 RepID=A0A0P1G7W3_9RHOB|nr:ROK family transcriptional regulator [Tritonibacter multivorans]MDA7422292.1 ROK family transcriptional regulator [Tritonibacter multivorans]CUH77759.1 N-acetylmannosamine kinase [Tritonibacter multivorans]SFD12340.1 transcriptional regulator, MarR family [Tritonibacter multivorans]
MTEARTYSSGASQSELRNHNERLILTILQREGAMAGSDLARLTGLSPQTTSVILRKLEHDALLARGETQKGRVGKPSVPMGINPEGLFSFGVKIGRRSSELALINFNGEIQDQRQLHYPFPRPEEVFGFLAQGLQELTNTLPHGRQDRIAGIGVGMAFDIWRWHQQIGAPRASLESWRELDLNAEMARISDLPVFSVNDATAACRAEHMLGGGKAWRDYVYFYIGSFLGGGIVLNNSVYEGGRGNAGALGPLPVTRPDGPEGRLLDLASLTILEQDLGQNGQDPRALWDQPGDWSEFEAQLAPWIEACAAGLARGALASCAVIDFEAVVIDGAFPEAVRRRVVERTRSILPSLDARGLILPEVAEGQIGADARVLGAATKPIIAQYFLDNHAGLAA